MKWPTRRKADDSGVTEVIGFVLMFALSAIVLVVSVQNFTDAKSASEDVIVGVEMKAVASRVSTRLVQAATISQNWPDAYFNATLIIPPQVAGYDYSITISSTDVAVETTDRGIAAASTTFRLDALNDVDVQGTAYSSRGAVSISYRPDGAGGIIEIQEGAS